jgi:hypothetical protein
MKGIVFTEFLGMVETTFSIDMADDIIENSDLHSQGSYTAVGTYDHKELVEMVIALSDRTGLPVNALVKVFGQHLFSVFAKNYAQFFQGFTSALPLLEGIEDIIHTEVLKLYPDAQLPKFACHYENDTLVMDYQSPRHFADLAEGLILGCGTHFQENLVIERQEVNEDCTRFFVKSC